MMTAKEYIDSLRKLNTRVYMFGEKLDNWVDHPMIRPSINCVAMTYALAQDPQYEEQRSKFFHSPSTFSRAGRYESEAMSRALRKKSYAGSHFSFLML